MHIDKLGMYAEARAFCVGKRYAHKGRRIDNYTVLRLENAGTDSEFITIGQKRWVSKDSVDKNPVAQIAMFYPDNTIICDRIGRFSTHQLSVLFHVWADRDRHNYKVLKDTAGGMVMYGEPVRLKMIGPNGISAQIIDGTPVPLLEKKADASTEWAKAKRQFDRSFKCALMVGAFVEVYHGEAMRDRMYWRHRNEMTTNRFVEIVRSMDLEAMVHYLLPLLYIRQTSDLGRDHLLAEYRRYYERRRRDILIAAGARVDAN